MTLHLGLVLHFVSRYLFSFIGFFIFMDRYRYVRRALSLYIVFFIIIFTERFLIFIERFSYSFVFIFIHFDFCVSYFSSIRNCLLLCSGVFFGHRSLFVVCIIEMQSVGGRGLAILHERSHFPSLVRKIALMLLLFMW